jgi:molybdopterin molybdotransferase
LSSGTREFFTVRRVSEALDGFRPRRRTAPEEVETAQARGRVLVDDVTAAGDLPGFARASVDGYAVRARDTFGASEGLPTLLDLHGSVPMGDAPESPLPAGGALGIATGGALPPDADAVVMVEHTAETMPGSIEINRPAAPGDGVVRPDEDRAAGARVAAAGRPLRAQELALLAGAGVTRVQVYARPRVAILSTGDELVPAAERPPAGRVRDSTSAGLAALVEEAGGQPELRGIVPDDRERLRTALEEAVAVADVVVVSAGSSVGARDSTAAAVASLGPPGIWCHGLRLKPGKPTLLAEAGEVPLIGLPGNPQSALVVFRLLGMDVVRRVGGCVSPPPSRTVSARLERDVPSAAGRYDVVQVRLEGDLALPVFGRSALLSPLVSADGFVRVDEDAGGLYAGAEVQVELYG